MVKETQTGVDVGLAGTIQIEPDGNLSFVGIALDDGYAGRVAQVLVYRLPTRGGEGGAGIRLCSY